ncbi:MAG: polyhydroxyalkanoic acid system family protein [Deltaproteobacteria bacterium]|nr:polyhydroxyalkanoic acid system family protein [Deltaproteobacteria bacterium]
MGDLTIEHRFTMPKDDARARLQALGEYLQNKHGLSVSWSGDTANVSGRYLVVSIEGRLTVSEGAARFAGKDPGFLWRGKAKDYLEHKLRTYLDPGKTLNELPRR